MMEGNCKCFHHGMVKGLVVLVSLSAMDGCGSLF